MNINGCLFIIQKMHFNITRLYYLYYPKNACQYNMSLFSVLSILSKKCMSI